MSQRKRMNDDGVLSLMVPIQYRADCELIMSTWHLPATDFLKTFGTNWKCIRYVANKLREVE